MQQQLRQDSKEGQKGAKASATGNTQQKPELPPKPIVDAKTVQSLNTVSEVLTRVKTGLQAAEWSREKWQTMLKQMNELLAWTYSKQDAQFQTTKLQLTEAETQLKNFYGLLNRLTACEPSLGRTLKTMTTSVRHFSTVLYHCSTVSYPYQILEKIKTIAAEKHTTQIDFLTSLPDPCPPLEEPFSSLHRLTIVGNAVFRVDWKQISIIAARNQARCGKTELVIVRPNDTSVPLHALIPDDTARAQLQLAGVDDSIHSLEYHSANAYSKSEANLAVLSELAAVLSGVVKPTTV
jgi:hypothetical protein